MRVDHNDIALPAQRVRYNSGFMSWEFTLFDGRTVEIYDDRVPVQQIDLMTVNITEEQRTDALNWFNKEFDTNEDFRVGAMQHASFDTPCGVRELRKAGPVEGLSEFYMQGVFGR